MNLLDQARHKAVVVVAMLALAALGLSACQVRSTQPEPTPPAVDTDEAVPPAIDTDEHTVYFLEQESEPSDILLAEIEGPMVLDDAGCLRIGDTDGWIIIWPASGYTVDLIDDEVALIDQDTGDVIASVGDWIALGGIRGSQREPDEVVGQPLPDACADADGYHYAGGLDGIERIEPDEELKEIEGWD